MRSLNLATTMPTFRPAPSRDPTCSTTAPAARLVALALPPTERRSPSPTVLASRPRGGPAAPRLLPAGLAKMAALGPATPEAFKHPALVALAVTMSPQQCPSLSCLCLLGCFGGGLPAGSSGIPRTVLRKNKNITPSTISRPRDRQREREAGARQPRRDAVKAHGPGVGGSGESGSRYRISIGQAGASGARAREKDGHSDFNVEVRDTGRDPMDVSRRQQRLLRWWWQGRPHREASAGTRV